MPKQRKHKATDTMMVSSSKPDSVCLANVASDKLNREQLRPEIRADILHLLETLSSRSASRRNFGFDYSTFSDLWRVFNTWTRATITNHANIRNDSAQIFAAGRDIELSERFDDLLENNRQFAESAHQFRDLWPVFSESWLRDNQLDIWGAASSDDGHKLTRSEYRALCFQHNPSPADYRPRCFVEHQTSSADNSKSGGDPAMIDLNWPHTIQAIYMVRCNLTHDLKATYVGAEQEDLQFIRLSYELLWLTWAVHFQKLD